MGRALSHAQAFTSRCPCSPGTIGIAKRARTQTTSRFLRNPYAAHYQSPTQFDGPHAHDSAIKKELFMSLELWLGACVALIVLVYLLAVLARPERF